MNHPDLPRISPWGILGWGSPGPSSIFHWDFNDYIYIYTPMIIYFHHYNDHYIYIYIPLYIFHDYKRTMFGVSHAGVEERHLSRGGQGDMRQMNLKMRVSEVLPSSSCELGVQQWTKNMSLFFFGIYIYTHFKLIDRLGKLIDGVALFGVPKKKLRNTQMTN